jgi:hypothetical protein
MLTIGKRGDEWGPAKLLHRLPRVGKGQNQCCDRSQRRNSMEKNNRRTINSSDLNRYWKRLSNNNHLSLYKPANQQILARNIQQNDNHRVRLSVT